MDNADAPLHIRLGRETEPPLAHRLKKMAGRRSCDCPWRTSFQDGQKHPRQESNLVYDLRTVACFPAHSEDMLLLASRQGVEPRLAESKSAVLSVTLARCRVARPGIEPGPTASEADMRSSTPTGHVFQHLDLGSNQDLDFRRVPCGPLHHRDSKSRRLDSHQHEPLYKSGAFLSRATSACLGADAVTRHPASPFGREHQRNSVAH